MITRRPLSLAPLSLPDSGPAAFLRCAGSAGYDHVALRLIGGDPGHPPADMVPLVRSASELADLRAILDGEGLTVREIEVMTIGPDTDIAASRPMLDMAARLGASHLVVCIADPDMGRAAERLAEIAGLARAHGLLVEVEFVPYTELRTIEAATDLIRRSGAEDVGILIDALHLARSGGDPAAVAAVAPERLRCLQLCDARRSSPADLIHEARTCRQAPGTGELDLAGLLRAMPADAALCVEAPHIEREAAIGSVAFAVELRVATESLLAALEREPA